MFTREYNCIYLTWNTVNSIFYLFCVFSPVRILHITALSQFRVHSECSLDGVWSLGFAAGQFEIIPKQLFVVGMRTILDDSLRTFFRTLATKVGNTLFGDDDIYRMLAVVEVRHHRNDSADLTFLSHRRTSEDRDLSVAGEVARAADTVHHLRATDVGRVHVTVNIRLDSRIDGNYTETANHFGAV